MTKLKWGMIGGGEGSQIGPAHRLGALADGHFELAAGALARLDGFDYQSVAGWIAVPLNSVLLVVFVATLFYHSSLGVQVVIEDYIHEGGSKVVALIAAKFVHFLAAAVAIFAVLRVSLGALA